MSSQDVVVRLRVAGQAQFNSSMAASGKSVESVGTKAQQTSKRYASALKAMGGAAATFAAGKVLKDSVKNAVDLGETMNANRVVFGKQASAIEQWAKGAATGFGQSRQQAIDAASSFGGMLKNMGYTQKQAAGMSTNLTELASDMASLWNTSPQQAIEALGSAFRGETDPIEKYRVTLNETAVNQKLMEMGAKRVGGQFTQQQKTAARYALILEQTKSAQGDFARTSDSLAQRQRVLQAQYANLTATLGTKLIPVLSFLANNLGLVAAAMAILTTAYFAFSIAGGAAAIAAGTFNVALFAIPIAIAAVIAGLVLAYQKVGWFRTAVNFLWKLMKTAFGWIKANWKLLASILGGPFVAAAILIISNFKKIIAFVKGVPGKISAAAVGMWDGIKHAFRSAINWIIGAWNSLHFRIPGFDPPGPGPKFGGVTVSVPHIPLLAQGGVIGRGGMAVVGERGPELVSLPTGATVTPSISGVTTTANFYLDRRLIATAVAADTSDRNARR